MEVSGQLHAPAALPSGNDNKLIISTTYHDNTKLVPVMTDRACSTFHADPVSRIHMFLT
jgi:hypothetical protein